MNNVVLFSYALLAASSISFPLSAECIPSPDCATLGYDKSETGCNGAPFVRCPFDISKVACLVSVSCEDSKDNLVSSCNANEYHCTQQNFGGNICWKQGAALTCEEKLAKGLVGCCTNSDCRTGQICNNNLCKDVTCLVGDIYYSDKTCSTNLITGKTPIGVVGYVSNGGKNGRVVALDTTGGFQWGCGGMNLTHMTDYTSQSQALSDFSGKSNTDTIISKCTSNTAAYYCKNTYSKGGISGWYLPAYGELYAILYTNFSTVNTGLGKISSSNKITGGVEFWSSSEFGADNALTVSSGNSNWLTGHKYYSTNNSVRCVLAF